MEQRRQSPRAPAAPAGCAGNDRRERTRFMQNLRRLLWLAPALLIAACLPRPAEAQYFGQNKVQYRTYDWRYISSDHFDVYYYSGLDSLAMRVMDLAEKTNVYLS